MDDLDANSSIQGAGAIQLTSGTDGTGSVVFNASSTTTSTGGNITITAGDDVTIPTGAALSVPTAANTITINLDSPSTGATGNTATVNGTLTASLTTVTGNNLADTFDITAQANSPIFVAGKNPTVAPGDVLNLTLPAAIATTNLIPTKGNGYATSVSALGIGNVSFIQIETYNPSGFTANNVRVRGDLSTDAVLTAAPYNLPAGQGFQDNVADTISVTRPDATNVQLQYTDGTNTASTLLPIAQVSSLDLNGSNDNNTFQISETANGLPTFAGTAVNSHSDSGSLPAGTLSVNNASINVTGGTGTNSLAISLLTAHDTLYFSDQVGTAKSGNINIRGTNASLISFQGLQPISFLGAGGDLQVDASLNASLTTMTVADDATPGDGVSVVTGNGTFESASFKGYTTMSARSGPGADVLTLQGLDSATSLTAINLDGGNIAGTDNSADTLFVNSLPATVTATLRGEGGDDKFRLWGNGGVPNSNTLAILGPVFVSPTSSQTVGGTTIPFSEAGTDLLDIRDFGNSTTARTIGINSTTITGALGTGANTITYDNIANISDVGSSLNDTYNLNFLGTDASTGQKLANVTLSGYSGNDQFNLLSSTPATVFTRLNGDYDPSNPLDGLTVGQNNTLAAAPKGNDSFVFSNNVKLNGFIDGGSPVGNDTDTIDWSAYTTARQVRLTGHGADGFGFNGVEDGTAGNPASDSITTGLGGIDFANIDVVKGSTANGSTPTTGDRLIQDVDNATTWNVTSNNNGNLTDAGPRALAFTSFENLTGAANSSDLFVLSNGVGISGQLDGRGADGSLAMGLGGRTVPTQGDTLSYAAYTTPINVNLTTGVATGIGGNIVMVSTTPGAENASIENV